MFFGMEIALLIVGILALVRGKIGFSKTQAGPSEIVRLAGLVMLLPIPIGFLVGFYVRLKYGPPTPATEAVYNGGGMVETGATVLCAVLSVLILLTASQRPASQPRSGNVPQRRGLAPGLVDAVFASPEGPRSGPGYGTPVGLASEDNARGKLERAVEEQAGDFLLGAESANPSPPNQRITERRLADPPGRGS
jgi:hypothetical protein